MKRSATTLACAALVTSAAFPALGAGQLEQSWKTSGGWLTELRVHPDGAKVCSTAKGANTPHTFGLSFVRSGNQNVLLLVDEKQPPQSADAGEMTFAQNGATVGSVKTQVDGPAWAASEPQAATLMQKLAASDVTISVAGREYQANLDGLPEAMAQLDRCLKGAA